MKVPNQSKRFNQTVSIAIAAIISISICEISLARPRGGGGSPRVAPSSFGSSPRGGAGNNQFSRPSRVGQSNRPSFQNRQLRQTEAIQVEQFRQRVEDIKNTPQFQQRIENIKNSSQFQQRVEEIKNNSQFQQRVEEIKNNPQFQQRVEEIRQNIQTNPEAQQTLQQLQQSRQQFKVERREDWQNYLNETRDERQDNRYYYDPYYWNVGYGYDYFWGGYYPGYLVPLSGLSVSLFAGDYDRYYYDSNRYYPLPDNQNYPSSRAGERVSVSSLPEGFISIALNSQTYYYYLGTFYLLDSATGNYAVTPPPVGAVVPYIPTEYQKVTVNGTQYYQYAGIYYRPTYVKGQLLYKVVKV